MAGSPRQRRHFEAIRALVTDPRIRLLLLSATPTLHTDEVGFQALLHLLDPAVYPLGDLAGFRERLGRHERVAKLYHLFRPDEEGSYLEGALDQFTDAFPADERLGELARELWPLLGYGADPDDQRRERLVRALRSHISEAYRLHRRLLRNRRVDERVQGLLPGREGLERWTYEDESAAHRALLLAEWRDAALAATDPEAAADYGRLLALFAERVSGDPATLAALIDLRLGEAGIATVGDSRTGQRLLVEMPLFAGERGLLARLRDAAAAADTSPRVAALAHGLAGLFRAEGGRVKRAVVFAGSPAVADRLLVALSDPWPNQVLRHGRPGWHHFRTCDSFRVLVCDASAEEGLNLNGRGTMLVHYDLPWSPNRVEQRLGRLDRYGVGTPVLSALPVASGDLYAAAWADYLDRGYRLFERSVAALQYVTEAELVALYPAVLAEGPAGLSRAVERLGGDDGLVETTLAEILVLDELDAVEAPAGHETFAEELRAADVAHRDDWQVATHDWAVEALQFGRRREGETDSGVWRYQFRRPVDRGGPSTLMPVGRLIRHFRHIVDNEAERSTPTEPLTYPLTFDRTRAQGRRVSLARIGDPFIDALAEYVGWDDRGAVTAFWRYRPKVKVNPPAALAFRFDFIVECPIEAALAALPVDGTWTPRAVRRQADWLFPPFALPLWLNDQNRPIKHTQFLQILQEDYSKRRRRDGGHDYNLNPDRWARLDAHVPRADWALQVAAAREAAEASVRGSDQWRDEVATRFASARRTAADREAQAESRLAFLDGVHRRDERDRAEVERTVFSALIRGIEEPTVRLDAVGAVFVSDWNPFADDGE